MKNIHPLAFEMQHIVKKFGDNLANDNVSLSVKKGEVHAVVGENGAGKSTIVKILYGLYQADSGNILIDGKPAVIHNSEQAINLGIGMVHQHFMLVEEMTVLENIMLSNINSKYGIVLDYKSTLAAIKEIAQAYNFNFDLQAKVRDLEVGKKQRLEIFKTIYRNSNILILDEPTSVLTKLEVNDLFNIIRLFKERGKTVIIITHKLDEVMEIADRVTIMRSGKVVGHRLIEQTNIEELAGLMVGHKLAPKLKTKPNVGKVVLTIKNLSYRYKQRQILSDINLSVHAGEIVGIAGISGNGQSDLEQIIAGMIKKGVSGQIQYNDINCLNKTTAEIRGAGFAHIPSDRLRWAYLEQWVNYQNIFLGYQFKPAYNWLSVWLNFGNIKHTAKICLDKYSVSPSDINYYTKSLSGGNQQKLIVSRELESNPSFILICQPTQGVDIGSVSFIHQKIIEARDTGKAILLISSELDEIKDLADRSFVICAGKIVDQIDWEKDDEKSIGIKMIGA